ncbi:flagellar basal body rod protein FlgC [soil metagenome]
MSLFNVLDIAGSGVSAQSRRLNTVASNLANVDSAASSDAEVYRAKQVVFQTAPTGVGTGHRDESGVKVSNIVEDKSPARRVYDPKHPMAGEDGFVSYPNVNAVEEMVNMISASRSYQSNLEVMNTSKSLLLKTLQLGS